MNKGTKDLFYDSLTDSRGDFTAFSMNHTGEQSYLDFKQVWINGPDLAKEILGFANTGGGVIVFGVTQNKDNTFDYNKGLDNLEDESTIRDKVGKYIPNDLTFNVFDFDYKEDDYSKLKGRKYQVLKIETNALDVPYICTRDGTGIKKDYIYVRRGTSVDMANKADIDELLEKRLNAMIEEEPLISLESHLGQLKTLYSHIDKVKIVNSFDELFASKKFDLMLGQKRESNPFYPSESFDGFIARMIDYKKQQIEQLLRFTK